MIILAVIKSVKALFRMVFSDPGGGIPRGGLIVQSPIEKARLSIKLKINRLS